MANRTSGFQIRYNMEKARNQIARSKEVKAHTNSFVANKLPILLSSYKSKDKFVYFLAYPYTTPQVIKDFAIEQEKAVLIIINNNINFLTDKNFADNKESHLLAALIKKLKESLKAETCIHGISQARFGLNKNYELFKKQIVEMLSNNLSCLQDDKGEARPISPKFSHLQSNEIKVLSFLLQQIEANTDYLKPLYNNLISGDSVEPEIAP